MAIPTDFTESATASAVIEWTLENGAGLRALFDAGHRIATSDRPPDAIADFLREREVRIRLTEWATFAATRWPGAWSIATGFCRAWMMKQSLLLLSFNANDRHAHRVESGRPPDPGCTAELMDLLAVGRVVRNRKSEWLC